MGKERLTNTLALCTYTHTHRHTQGEIGRFLDALNFLDISLNYRGCLLLCTQTQKQMLMMKTMAV